MLYQINSSLIGVTPTNDINMKNATATTKTASKATVKTTKASAPADKKQSLKDSNVKALKAETAKVDSEPTIYAYPKDNMSKVEKKNFRRQARATIESFTKKLAKADKAAKPAIEKEFTAWKKTNLSPSHQLMTA